MALNTAEAAGQDLIGRVLAGHSPRLARLAAEGVLPLDQAELVRLQVELASKSSHCGQEVSQIARNSIAELDVSYLVQFVRYDAATENLEYFLRPEINPAVVEAAIQRKGVAPEALKEAAPRLDERAQEVLLLRQDLITEYPEILDGLAANPKLTNYSRRLIAEYAQHLLRPVPVTRAGPEIDLEVGEGALSDEEAVEVEEAIVEVLETVPAEGEYDERTGLTEGQVRMLTLPIRIKLARGAGRTLRGILVRDANPQVAVGVLKASAFSEGEAEIVAANRYVCGEVLLEITLRRDWVGRYAVAHNVVKNPRTPVAAAVKLLPRLSVRDLGLLRRDRNVSEAVRQMAARIHMMRSK